MRSFDRGFLTVALVAFIVLAAACSSGTSKVAPAPASTSVADTTVATVRTPTPTRPRAQLQFRAVEYANGSPIVAPYEPPGVAPDGLSPCWRLTSQSSHDASPGPAIVFDRERQNCYRVGPVLLTGAGITSALIAYDAPQTQWAVDLRWGNDDFLKKIARPLVGREVAIVLNGIVQSAPVIEPGITGSDVDVNGDFSRSSASNVAASIMGIAPSQVPVDSNG